MDEASSRPRISLMWALLGYWELSREHRGSLPDEVVDELAVDYERYGVSRPRMLEMFENYLDLLGSIGHALNSHAIKHASTRTPAPR